MRCFYSVIILFSLVFGVAAQALQPKSPTSVAQSQSKVDKDPLSENGSTVATSSEITNVLSIFRFNEKEFRENLEKKEKARLDLRLVELTYDLANYTKWLAYSTIVLTVATIGLFVFAVLQAGDARRASKFAALSAEAANLSATAGIRSELPIVIARRFQPLHAGNNKPILARLPKEIIIKVEFFNYGRTPAEVIEESFSYRVGGINFEEFENGKIKSASTGSILEANGSQTMTAFVRLSEQD